MSETFDADALIDAVAAYAGLPVLEEYRAGVRFHLTAARAIVADVLAFELEDDAEPAPVYRP